MNFSAEKIDNIKLHFILCTERTGSSLLSLMLNLNSEILSPSEEPFALYFYRKYRNKINWSRDDISKYVQEFFLLAEKNTTLYFSERSIFEENLIRHQEILNWSRLVKLTYLHFIDIKDKSNIEVIVDKQIKYFFHLKLLTKLFPESRFIILVRDVRDNIVSKKNRQLNWNQHPLFLASIWKDTYQQLHVLKPSSYIVIRYEDIMSNTQDYLKKICDWINVPFQESMTETEGKYLALIEAKRNLLDPKFVEHLLKFHSGLNKPSSTDKIEQYKKNLSQKEIELIENICNKELIQFGYHLTTNHKFSAPILSIYYRFLAKAYRNWLLKCYLLIPLSIKLFIKRKRRKIVSV